MENVLRGSVSWTAPVLHRGVLYLRNLKPAAQDQRAVAGRQRKRK